MYKSYFFYFFLLCTHLSFLASAQEKGSAEFIPETILIKTDRQLYISGETVWCKLYAFDATQRTLSNFSKLAYLEIISPDGIPVSRVKIDLKKGHGAGTIELPGSLISGSYDLRAYTKAMRNMGEQAFAKSSLIILNSKQAIGRVTEEDTDVYQRFIPTQPSFQITPENQLNINMQTTQGNVSQRNMATIEFTATDLNGQAVEAQFSVSVALPSPNGINSKVLFQKTEKAIPISSIKTPATITFIPEDRGQYLEGRVVNELTEKGEARVLIYLAFPGETARVYAMETDVDGRFSFLLPKLYGLRQVILQAPSSEEVPLKIELTEEFEQSIPKSPENFILPPDWIPVANAAMVNAQIDQSYQTFELPPVYSSSQTFADIPFFGSPEAAYTLDDYTRFPIPEFFYEVVPEVVIKGKFGEERASVYNEWQGFSEEIPPLLLVDGVPVFDQPTFLKINNKLIASTEIVSSPFLLNVKLFDGIIQLSSFENDARCFDLPESALRRSYLTLLPERQFSTPNYKEKPDSRLPDFRNTLYWNPTVHTDENGKATISFYTSDAIGDFEIRVEGVSETGLLGSTLGTIKVEKLVP